MFKKYDPNHKDLIRKPPQPIIIVNRLNLFSWLASCLIFAGCFFIIGVIVGRGTAPVTFDIQRLGDPHPNSLPEIADKSSGKDSVLIQEPDGDIIEKLREPHPPRKRKIPGVLSDGEIRAEKSSTPALVPVKMPRVSPIKKRIK